MNLKLIKNEEDYNMALTRLEKIFHAKSNTPEKEELELLVLLIEKCETEIVGEFPDPDPVEAIKFKMEQMDLNQQDLANIIGLKSK